MISLSWRQIYVITIILRFFFGLSDSYIHPDEHFQSFEVLSAKFFGFNTNIPWEFTSDTPARSFGPLYLFYGPIFLFLEYFNISITPKGIWYLLRLQLILMSWLITDSCLFRILPTKPERVKAIFFTSTSYITLVYQSHCFSNSLETPLLLACVWIISDLRYDLEVRDVKNADYTKLFYFGILTSIGIFNRVTFIAFILIPVVFLVKYCWRFKLGAFVSAFGFGFTSLVFILIDTIQFKGSIPSTFIYNDYVITPLNNVVYNLNHENLEVHGIHPYYTHILVNLPQILGPLIIVFFYKGKNSYYKTVPFISFVSGILVLSLVPHQELRFLVPLLPVACCCLDFNRITGSETENEEIKKKITSEKPDKVISFKSKLVNGIIFSWYVFNLFMCILMGIFHQGGVVPALDYTHNELVSKNEKFVQIWWRTYSPPSWLLGSTSSKTVLIDEFDPNVVNKFDHIIIDAMGSDPSYIYDLVHRLQKIDHKLMIVSPVASMNCEFDTSNIKSIWNTKFHIDLDHLNFDSMSCLEPGLSIYELI